MAGGASSKNRAQGTGQTVDGRMIVTEFER
jgi:hypothetical protein